MKKLRLTISTKIIAGFLFLILIFLGIVINTTVTVSQNNEVIAESRMLSNSLTKLKDFNTMVIRNQMLVTNWVYLQSDEAGKASLRELHSRLFPEIRQELNILMEEWEGDTANVMRTKWVLGKMDTLLQQEKSSIMETLVSFEDYQDPMTKFTAEEGIDSFVIPDTKEILDSLNLVILEKKADDDDAKDEIEANSDGLSSTTIGLGLGIFVIAVIISFFLARSITRPITYIKGIIQKLGRGELPDDQDKKRVSNDEIGEMSVAVDNLVSGLRSTSNFAESIGNGNYDAAFNPLSEHDVLGNALIEMRNNLQSVAEEDKRRNWATEGLAKFGEILRQNNDNLEKLSDEIISNLIKYLKANQGGLYIINSEEGEDEEYMTLTACYAWDKRKYLDQRISKGDGLTGQSWLEQGTIYLTEVPNDYVSITSGLGEANPRSILIVPLKVNEDVYGVVEIASFREFEPYEIEFVERIAESIASTISSVKITERTQSLLEESTNMTEMMRAQEEEMRQNMEELQATQEEMERSQRETEDKERIITATSIFFELNERFQVISTNSLISAMLGYPEGELNGKGFQSIVADVVELDKMKATISEGEPWAGIIRMRANDGAEADFHLSAGKSVDMSTDSDKYLIFATKLA